ncbi:MAG: class I SAM-dependent methyltransferase [Wenzhouxiangella sp.]
MSTDAVFAADWLSRREPADHTARSSALAARLNDHFAGRTSLAVVDLGAGHGSNLRWLAPRLAARQHWLLVDHDPGLLAHARIHLPDAAAAGQLTIDTLTIDLATLRPDVLAGCDLVTASALFDLVSEAWLTSLAQACHAHRCAALFALSVNGDWRLIDADGAIITDNEDHFVRDAFNRHQRRNKGLGAALGPEAAAALPSILTSNGFVVDTRPSDWLLPAGARLTLDLGRPLLAGWRDAAIEQAPQAAARIRHWHDQRNQALRAGKLGLEVGHVDLLALPEQ